jgi:predicted HicB family RNase H-like nuclease
MVKKRLTREEEYELYKDPAYQEPQGPARRRRSRLTEMVPVRFSPEVLEHARRLADADDRSLSSWIRRLVEREIASHN